jgi:hypothetical protein
MTDFWAMYGARRVAALDDSYHIRRTIICNEMISKQVAFEKLESNVLEMIWKEVVSAFV